MSDSKRELPDREALLPASGRTPYKFSTLSDETLGRCLQVLRIEEPPCEPLLGRRDGLVEALKVELCTRACVNVEAVLKSGVEPS